MFLFALEELADVERLKQIFRAYFADHEIYIAIGNDDLQAIVNQRAHACASKYRQKLRRLHLSHTDYYLDTIQHLTHENTQRIRKENPEQILSISVV